MTDKVEKLEKQVDGLIAVLFQLADDLRHVSSTGQAASLADLTRDIQGAGGDLWQVLVALNDGRGPTGQIGSQG